ncbi:squalene/phytoene synthase family protein [Myxococcota bacterium]|nr:squalene/phytoene synthase family protein [Myxococcota bacterium]
MSINALEPPFSALSLTEAQLRADMAACGAILERGSRSFALAARLLSVEIRGPVAALYAFCRVSDDAVDDSDDPARVARLRARLDQIYQLTPQAHPVDRAFTAVAQGYDIPRRVLDLMLEGFEWDATGRRYARLEDTVAYGVRVASSVGVMMCMLMERRAPSTLARAADLGIAMQLTNIARDVGEDARRGRLYLPEAWLREEGVDPEAFLAAPRFSEGLGRVVARLLAEADRYYARAEAGIGALPPRARPAIRAAALIYQRIGAQIAAVGYDSVGQRAVTTKGQKIRLAIRALGALFWRPGPPQAPCPEAKTLIKAAAHQPTSVEFILPRPAPTPEPADPRPAPPQKP